uniref:KH-like RNA-binding domain-containing protein n=1 Tax=Catagonus wagneri TaxID=51154 RepID=A0A8C3VWJ9_9CETA
MGFSADCAVEAPGHEWTQPASEDWPLRLPLPLPRFHSEPRWFLVQELRSPLVSSPEAWLADSIFGPDRALILEMEWMIQALLTADAVNAGNLVEITVFGWPGQGSTHIITDISLVPNPSGHNGNPQHEFLKAHVSVSRLPTILLPKYCQGHENSPTSATKIQEKTLSLNLRIFPVS